MKTIEEVLDNYYEYATFLDDRFGARFCQFLTIEQAARIGFESANPDEHVPVEWNEDNVLKQLKQDVDFGYMKACDERGMSSSLMYEVVSSWCKVLDNGIDTDMIGYVPYGKPLFEAVAKHYGWELTD